MNHQFVLSDFENVPFTDIGVLKPGQCRIKVFLSQTQTKVPLKLAQSLQPFGADVEYIQIAGSGPNALDFHIAYYIGKLSTEFPGSDFTIISGDTGFDPLIQHLKQRGIGCKRIAKIPTANQAAIAPVSKQKIAAPAPKAAADSKPTAGNGTATALPPITTTTRSRAALILKRLRASNAAANRPKSLDALRSYIKACIQPPVNEKQLNSVVQSLADSKKIVVKDKKVTYAV